MKRCKAQWTCEWEGGVETVGAGRQWRYVRQTVPSPVCLQREQRPLEHRAQELY